MNQFLYEASCRVHFNENSEKKGLESHKATDVNEIVATFVHDKAIIFSVTIAQFK